VTMIIFFTVGSFPATFFGNNTSCVILFLCGNDYILELTLCFGVTTYRCIYVDRSYYELYVLLFYCFIVSLFSGRTVIS